ncbi:unnamed protein product, partial [Iphiclides podalirius]
MAAYFGGRGASSEAAWPSSTSSPPVSVCRHESITRSKATCAADRFITPDLVLTSTTLTLPSEPGFSWPGREGGCMERYFEGEERKEADKKIQQRWRTARDTYQKDKISEKNQPSGSGSKKKKKKYSYYDILTFLDSTTETAGEESLCEEMSEQSNLENT